MIVLAAFSILWVAASKWLAGIPLENLSAGRRLTFAASAINPARGLYLLAVGRRNHSIILEANGRHALTDSWTSHPLVRRRLVLARPDDPPCRVSAAHLRPRAARRHRPQLARSVDGEERPALACAADTP